MREKEATRTDSTDDLEKSPGRARRPSEMVRYALVSVCLALLVVLPQYRWYGIWTKQGSIGSNPIEDQNSIPTKESIIKENYSTINHNALHSLAENSDHLESARKKRIESLEFNLDAKTKQIQSLNDALAASQKEQTARMKDMKNMEARLEASLKQEKSIAEELSRMSSSLADKDTTIQKLSAELQQRIEDGTRKPSFIENLPPIQFNLFGRQVSVFVDAALIILEGALLLATFLVLMLVSKSRRSVMSAKNKYLAAYRRQQRVLALAEDALLSAQTLREGKEITHPGGDIVLGVEKRCMDPTEEPRTPVSGTNEDNSPEKSALVESPDVLVDEASKNAARLASWAVAAGRLLELASSPTEGVSGVAKSLEAQNESLKTENKEEDDVEIIDDLPSPTAVANAVAERCAELQRRLEAAVIAAGLSEKAAEKALEQQQHSDAKVSEVIANAEMLKEQLSDSQKAFADAKATLQAAETREERVASSLDEARQRLATVERERLEVVARAAKLQAELEVAEKLLQQSKDKESGLELRVDELSSSLKDEETAKTELERRCADVESEKKSLTYLAETLQSQVVALERELKDARATSARAAERIRSQSFDNEDNRGRGSDAMDASNLLLAHPIASIQGTEDEESEDIVSLPTGHSYWTKDRLSSAVDIKSNDGIKPIDSRMMQVDGGPPKAIHKGSYSLRLSAMTSKVDKIQDLLSQDFDSGTNLLTQDKDEEYSLQRSPRALLRRSTLNDDDLQLQGDHVATDESSMIPSQKVAKDERISNPSVLSRMSNAWEIITYAERFLKPAAIYEVNGNNSGALNDGNGARKRLHGSFPGSEDLFAAASLQNEKQKSEDAPGRSFFDRADREEHMLETVRHGAEEVDRVCAILDATNDTEAIRSAERLRSTQRAVHEAAQLSKSAAQITRERRAALQAAQMECLDASSEVRKLQTESPVLNTKNGPDAASSASEALKIAELELEAAKKAVYAAESAIHSAASTELQARNDLEVTQQALEEALKEASRLLPSLDDVDEEKSMGRGDDQGATTVSPRIPLSPEDTAAALLEVKFKGGRSPIKA